MGWKEELGQTVRKLDIVNHIIRGGAYKPMSAKELRLLTVEWKNPATYLSIYTEGIVRKND